MGALRIFTLLIYKHIPSKYHNDFLVVSAIVMKQDPFKPEQEDEYLS
jgi:hypothetical protein